MRAHAGGVARVARDMISFDAAYAASERRDATHDGTFVVAVATTGIYCNPSCPARMRKRENVRLFVGGEEARAAGYRACKRCRPA